MGYLLPQLTRLTWLQTVLICAACSVSIEFGQLFSKLGMLDVDDFIFNTAGAMLGAWCFQLRLWLQR